MFAILQKYDFSSKSQQYFFGGAERLGCLRYCKSTIFQANHNGTHQHCAALPVVCDTAKVRFFKQITTDTLPPLNLAALFAILQKYDFSSKSQPADKIKAGQDGCLRYCKSTIFQANHNYRWVGVRGRVVVCDTAKVRFFKQITTNITSIPQLLALFAILQKYDFSSKSQQEFRERPLACSCLRYCKSTIFQANHNILDIEKNGVKVVCDTAKVRFFKQITTAVAGR